jgi:hypothetical protein
VEPANLRRFGDKILGGWLRFPRNIKGRWDRSARGTYGHFLKALTRARLAGTGSNAGGFQTEREREKKVEETMLRGGVWGQWESEGLSGAGLARAGLGPGLILLLGWTVPFGPFLFFSLFLLFFFCFLISFITFANLVQIASNQLCKVSKIPSNIPE